MGLSMRLHGPRVTELIARAQVEAEAELQAERRPATTTSILDFFDIPTGDAFDVPPDRAIRFFKSKGLRPTFSYADMLGDANAHAFTIAKMMDVDLLGQVRASLDSALANGTSFSDWKETITPILQSAGWWGRKAVIDPASGQEVVAQLGSPWRLETIFRTNMQAAYAAGNWQEIEAQADVAPFLMYDAVDDFRTRPLHRAWDRTVLPVNSPWWNTHYPPNGYNCRCGVIQLDAEQARSLGLQINRQPPADGTVPFTNPRTGEVQQVPAGIDPGFAYNAGKAYLLESRQLLDEKISVLPQDMREAIAPVVRRQFDATTDAGKWHVASFERAVDWVRNRILDDPGVAVQTLSKEGAWAQSGRLVDMDGGNTTQARAQSTWRHEFGHIIDVRLGRSTLYRSSQKDFADAMQADADGLAVAAGRGRKSKANDARRAAVVAAYDSVRDRVVDAERSARPALLRDLAASAGLDFDQFLSVVRDSTLILEGGEDLADVGRAVRIARMLEALRLGDGEGFVRWAAFKDGVESMLAARQYDREAIKTSGDSWRKDGSLANLSDLIGASTRNRAANYKNGFPGHSDAYYRQFSYRPGTEAFANLTAMAGHPNAYWWTLVRKLAPQMAALFREIMEGQ